ncbi:MAG: HD domain-containing phosphohydrolase, partial [Candidatus Omnitrophota bacterium]
RAGYYVSVVKNGREALDLLKKKFFPMVITDWLMPEINGLELCRLIRSGEFPSYIFIIFITGRTEEDHIISALDAGADDYLTKPINLAELLARVKAGWRVLELERNLYFSLIKYKEANKRMNLISQIVQNIYESESYKDVLLVLLKETSDLIGATTASILFLTEEDKKLVVAEAWGKDRDKIVGLTTDLDEDRIACNVIKSKTPVFVGDINLYFKDKAHREQKRLESQSIISVPLLVRDKSIGVINFGTSKTDKPFIKEDMDFIAILASQISTAIERARLYEGITSAFCDLKESYILTIKVLTEAIDAKDHYTKGHSDRVTNFSVKIAERMGLSDEEKENIRKAGLVHDLGKIGLSEKILNKPGGLTPEEFEEVKKHPAKGAEIIEPIKALVEVSNIIRHHHERVDGKGYPDGIKGEEIPLEARIMAVADTYDAMTSDRPYRKGYSKEKAVEEIKNCAGAQFDPDVVRVFLQVVDTF